VTSPLLPARPHRSRTGHYYLHPDYVMSDDYDGSFDSETSEANIDYVVAMATPTARVGAKSSREFLLPTNRVRQLFTGKDGRGNHRRTGWVPLSLVYGTDRLPSQISQPTKRSGADATLDPRNPRGAAERDRSSRSGARNCKTRTLAARVLFLIEKKTSRRKISSA